MTIRSCLWFRSLFRKYPNSFYRLLFETNNEDFKSPPITTTHAIIEPSSPSPIDGRIFPSNVIAKFFDNLSVKDVACMRLVCKQWRSVTYQQEEVLPITTPQQSPWRILSDDSYHTPNTLLSEICFSDSQARVYKFQFPKLQRIAFGDKPKGWCCGYSNGWLLLAVSRGEEMDPDMFMWNPLSGATSKLPPLSTLEWYADSRGKFRLLDNISSLISRVQVFKVESGVVVVAIVFCNPEGGTTDELALCKFQEEEKTWTVFREEEENFYEDILFHQGKLHVLVNDDLKSENETSRKASYTIHLTGCQLEVNVLHLVYEGGPKNLVSDAPPGFGISESGATSERLVESSTNGELLLVTTLFDHCAYLNWRQGPIGSFNCTQTKEFQVRRVVTIEGGDSCGVRLERLNSIGEQTIFLGTTSSFSLPGAAVIGAFETDRIYYATDEAGGQLWEGEVYSYLHGDDNDVYRDEAFKDETYVTREQGYFDVQRNSITRTSLTNLMFPRGSTIGWFMPKLF